MWVQVRVGWPWVGWPPCDPGAVGVDPVRRWAGSLSGEPGDVVASVAAALGVPWDGGGAPLVEVDPMPAAPAWELLDAAREASVAPVDRRRLGAHHTPPGLAQRLAAIALDGIADGATVLDPACGGGAFLVAAARLRPDVRVVGLDLDPLAVATCRAALRATGADHADVRVADGLVEPWEADVVVGNPPFLSPLGTGTGGTPAAATLRVELGAPYLDVAALFLLRALERTRPGGRVVLLQPESLLSSRDAGVVRACTTPALEGLWVAGEPVFAAGVRVVAPVLRAGGATEPKVRRWQGSVVRPVGAAARPAPATWSSLRPSSVPAVRVPKRSGRVGDLATATAGFRDEFYAVAAATREGGRGSPVVTSGLVDPGRVAWGERSARIGGRTFERPTLDPVALDARVRPWVAARLVPKVVVATQTRVVEAAADPDGALVPITPVLAVTPHDPADVWRLTAALTSPMVSAWALRTYGGTALAAEAVKLSAAQVLEAPLPLDGDAWAAATESLRAGDVVGCAAHLAAGDDRLLRWWQARLPARRTV